MLDFLVGTSIVICFAVDSPLNFTMFRLLRLLDLIQKSQVSFTLQHIVASFVDSFTQIIIIWLVLFLSIIIFSLVGIGSFEGATHYYCRITPQPVNGSWYVSPGDTYTCGSHHTCDENTTCGSFYKYTRLSDNGSIEINYGNTNYDDIFNSLITTFQASTLEGWGTLMYTLGNAHTLWVSAIYFILCIVVCGYFVFNMIIPVLQANFFNAMVFVHDTDNRMQFIKKLVSPPIGRGRVDHLASEPNEEVGGTTVLAALPRANPRRQLQLLLRTGTDLYKRAVDRLRIDRGQNLAGEAGLHPRESDHQQCYCSFHLCERRHPGHRLVFCRDRRHCHGSKENGSVRSLLLLLGHIRTGNGPAVGGQPNLSEAPGRPVRFPHRGRLDCIPLCFHLV